MAGSNKFLINHRTDIQAFCHADIIHIFHFCYSLGYSHPFSSQTSQDISFRVSSQCNKCFCIPDTLFQKQFHITSIPVDNHHFIIHKFSQTITTVQVTFYNLRPHIFRHILHCTHSNTASSHIRIMFLTGYFTDIRNVFLCCSKIYHIIQHNHIITSRDNCLSSSFNGYDVKRNISTSEFVQRYIKNFGSFTHLSTNQD